MNAMIIKGEKTLQLFVMITLTLYLPRIRWGLPRSIF
jgi:hypothetical protein